MLIFRRLGRIDVQLVTAKVRVQFNRRVGYRLGRKLGIRRQIIRLVQVVIAAVVQVSIADKDDIVVQTVRKGLIQAVGQDANDARY